jgi:hypothetical protein
MGQTIGGAGGTPVRPFGVPTATDRPRTYSPAAKAYLDYSVKLSQSQQSGPVNPAGLEKLQALENKLTPNDYRTMRYVSADVMKAQFSQSVNDPNPRTAQAAKNLISVIDNGILPGFNGAPTVYIDSGAEVPRETVLAAKQGPLPGGSSGWKP